VARAELAGLRSAAAHQADARSGRILMTQSKERARRRLVNFGELIALAALIVSAVGVWIAWKSSSQDKPTRVVEQRSAVPLALRGTADRDGRALTIAPADPAHALESATISLKGSAPIEIGGDGRLTAGDFEAALKTGEKEPKDIARSVSVKISARYVENGALHKGGGSYALRYKWEGGGLFGGRSIRLLGLSRG
jgi:hypothetical protein